MKINKKSILCKSRQEFIELHLSTLNALMPVKFTDKEIKILAHFLSVDDKLVEDDRFNSLIRKRVMFEHRLSAGGLGNYLKSMIDKGFLTRSQVTGRIKVQSFLMPDQPKQGYEIRIGYQEKQVHVKRIIKKGIVKRAEVDLRVEHPVKPEDAFLKEEVPNAFDQATSIQDFDEEEEESNEKPHKMS